MSTDLYKPDAGLTVWVSISIDNPRKQSKHEYYEECDENDGRYVGVTRPLH